jgi:hypothetical protein
MNKILKDLLNNIIDVLYLVFGQCLIRLPITARWHGELPSKPALSEAKGQGWHEFLQCPDKWAGFPCHENVVQMAESR